MKQNLSVLFFFKKKKKEADEGTAQRQMQKGGSSREEVEAGERGRANTLYPLKLFLERKHKC